MAHLSLNACLQPSFSRSLGSRQQIATRPSHPSLWCSLSLPSKKLRRTWYVHRKPCWTCPTAAAAAADSNPRLDYQQKRHQSDRELNARKAKVYDNGQFVDKPWRNIKVGDLVRLESNDFLPADLVVVSSSEPDGLAYIETSNLDGETNLKIKQASPSTAHFVSPESLNGFRGYLRSEQPNTSLYTYEGTLQMQGAMGEKTVPLSPDQMLLRGAQLRNTAWMYGLVRLQVDQNESSACHPVLC